MPLVNIPSHANITISCLLHIISHGFFCSPCEKQNNTLKILNENAVCCLLLTCLSLFTACHLCICVCLCAWEKGRFVGKCNSVLAAFLQRQTRQRWLFRCHQGHCRCQVQQIHKGEKKSEISGRKTFCYFLQWRLVLFKSRESLVNDKRCTDFYLLLAKTASQTTTELWKYLINIMNQAQNCLCSIWKRQDCDCKVEKLNYQTHWFCPYISKQCQSLLQILAHFRAQPIVILRRQGSMWDINMVMESPGTKEWSDSDSRK